ncbi:MAG: hypothetical protein KAG91_01840 [Mycoplasmataceae bacterium]|nr:hypothetical protein [Mycoplasmataceae bacterium]
MNKAKVIKSIRNLEKIREIIEISKFDTLNKLKQATEISNSFFEMGMIARDLVNFANKKYRLGKEVKPKKNSKTLWVYMTSPSELMSVNQSKYSKMLKENFNPETDLLVAIGEKAIKDSSRYGFKTIFEDSKVNKEIDTSVPALLSELVFSGEVSSIRFIINSPKGSNEPINIYPMSSLNFKYEADTPKIDKKYKFYPSIKEATKVLANIYISRISTALIMESKQFQLKEKLIRHEGSIKSVDEKIKSKTADMHKLNRKVETEELILVTQIAKRGVHDE